MNEIQIKKLIKRYNFTLAETHISWVLIGEKFVYKIKKPVNFGFLDYSTLEKRFEFCKKEIELNSRLAKEIYIKVSEITEEDDELAIDKKGTLIDYCVKMKKMPLDKMMDELIKQDKIKEDEIKALAKKISDFHSTAQSNKDIEKFGTIEQNRQNTDENFEQTKEATGDFIEKFQYESIKRYTDDFYKNNEELFKERIKCGKIKDCHGDMYSRNICIEDINKIYIYDCIEFNDRFRYSDTASDVAFLLMDLENYGRYDLSNLFLRYYSEFSKDDGLKKILNFYKIYRAFVRGKIAFFQQNRDEANRYFDLAFGYIPKIYKPKLIVMCGLSGSGKSYIANLLKDEINAEVISSDILRKQLAGLKEDEKDLSDFGKGIYSSKMSDRVYAQMSENAYNLLKKGKSAILDATYLTEKARNGVKESMKRLAIEPTTVFVDTDDKTVIEHFKKREYEQNASDGRYEIYIKQKTIFEKPANCITINPNMSTDKAIELIKNEIEK